MPTLHVGFAEVNTKDGKFLITTHGDGTARCQMTTPTGFRDLHRLKDIADDETRDLIKSAVDLINH